MADRPPRAGEVRLPFDPEARADAGVAFIGLIRSPWATRDDCPKNLREARVRGRPAQVVLAPGYAAGLAGLEAGRWVHLLYWMGEAARDLIVQAPRHRPDTAGVFAIRSPARPNPVAMGLVRITALDAGTGVLDIDAIDCVDGTPLVDIKPFIATVDVPPEAGSGGVAVS
jgi:tRNA-Thr(GGU) m(6)t(6)A37 methyltransferase TsaA